MTIRDNVWAPREWIACLGLLSGIALLADPGPAHAQAASVEPTVLTVASFSFDGERRLITQAPQIDIEAMQRFFHAYAACATTCIGAMSAAPGVETLGEQEVISFVTDAVASGQGILLDSRSPQERAQGYIATSVNVPLSLVSPDNPYLGQILVALGASESGDTYDFSNALPLVVYDDGPTTNEAPALIEALLIEGYPAEKIKYYRGGMQMWVALGLSFEE